MRRVLSGVRQFFVVLGAALLGLLAALAPLLVLAAISALVSGMFLLVDLLLDLGAASP